MFKDFKSLELHKYIYFSFIFFSMIFARSFVGLTLFGFRIGEVLIGLCFFFSLGILIPQKYLPKQIAEFPLIRIYKTIVISVFLIALVTRTSLLNTYFVRSSSYVWSVAFIFFGLYFLNLLRDNYYLIGFLATAPIIVYLFSTGRYPDFMMTFFATWSDKFQFIKGSDLMLTYVVASLSLIKLLKNKYISTGYLFFASGAFFPLLLFNSRGAFMGGFLFFIFHIFYDYKFLWKNKLFITTLALVSYILFYSSVLHVYGEFTFTKVNEATKPNIVTEKVTEIAKQKKTVETFRSFYIEDGRLYSDDNTTNWRLDIWQDLYHYMDDEDILLKGHGYKSIFPIMLDPSAPGRLGRDGLNENVHNYFANILGRGGLIQLLLFFFFYLKIISTSREINGDYKILGYILPILANSFFDANMEGVQYPFIFYSFLGFLFFKVKKDENSH